MEVSLDNFKKSMDDIHKRIQDRLGKVPEVFYSAYDTDEGGLPIDNLDEIAICSSIQFVAKYDPYWGEGHDYISSVVESPTWMEVAIHANEMIQVTGDYHHIYLENIVVVDKTEGRQTVEFAMGS